MTPSQRQAKSQLFGSFVSKYKPKYFYWEFIIFIRRICIAMFSVSVTNDNIKVLFFIIMTIFLCIQHQCEPFIIPAGNTMEWILLLCIMFIIALDLAFSVDPELKEYFTSFLIVFPSILFVYFMIEYRKRKSDISLNSFKNRVKYFMLWIIHYYSFNNNDNGNEQD